MLVFLLHSMKLLFTKPIPPNPASSKIIPIISETLYIYLIGFHQTNKEWFILFRFFPFYPTKTDVILSEPAIKLSLKNVILSCGSRNAMMYSNGK